MPQQRTQWITHRFGGGWATDFGPTHYAAPDGDTLRLPFLIDAQNIVYELNGGVHTMPGTTPFNASTLGASSTIKGIYDYWRQGTIGSPTQKVVAHVDTRVVAASISDGIFSNIGTGFQSGAVPAYSTFDDLLILANDASADVPKSWDQTTFQSLAGSPPNFSFSCTHKNRSWAAGVMANPSRLYYSVNLDPEDWISATSGSIDIDPSDGDVIVGLASFKNELWVFKGPFKGSIHRISGSSASDFARSTFVRGITAAYQNAIFPLPNDLGFMSPRGTVHSLVSTDRYGDYEQSTLSFPINRTLRASVSQNYYKNWWAMDDPINGMALIGYTPSGQTRNTRLLMMDYRFLGLGEPFPRWAQWTAFGADALAYVVDSGNRPRPFIGLNAGVIYKGDQADRTHNGSSLTPLVTTPSLTYGADHVTKSLHVVGIELAPKNANNFTLNWLRDGQTQQSDTFSQGGSDVLGPWTADQFTLNTSTLGGTRFLTRYRELETGGDFRSIRYQLTDTTNASDLEVHGLIAAIQPGGISTENTLS